MFYEWVAAGAAFGISAFSAVVVFVLCSAAVWGLIMMIASIARGNDDKGM